MQGTNHKTEQPFVTGNLAPLDAIYGAARYLADNWGDYGYRMGIEGSGLGAYLFGVRHSDGSEFYILSDRYGNCSQVEWDGSRWVKIASPLQVAEHVNAIFDRSA